MKTWENFSKKEVEQFVKESNDYNELAARLGYQNIHNGGTYLSIVNMIKELSLDVSHFKNFDIIFDNDNFKYGYKINKALALKALINLRGRKCEKCGLQEWLETPIALEIHHIDGDQLNNTIDNLQLLCPNCHATTNNWRGRAKKQIENITNDIGIYTNIYRSGNKTKDGIYKYYATCKICGTVVEKKLSNIKRNNKVCMHKHKK